MNDPLEKLSQVLFESMDQADPNPNKGWENLSDDEKAYYQRRVKDLLCHYGLVQRYYASRGEPE